MRYLDAAGILFIHHAIIVTTGGLHNVRDIGLLASIVVKPQQSIAGKELYPSLHFKAAAIMEALARYHVFTDGNKRTALVATARFLHINGWQLTATNKAAEKFMLRVVTNKTLTVPKIAAWLKGHSRKAI